MTLDLIRRASFRLIEGRCILCEARSECRLDLCRSCALDLPAIRHRCLNCSLPLPESQPRCLDCLSSPPLIRRTYCHFLYATPIDRMMVSFKEHGQRSIGHVMATLAADGVEAANLTPPDILVPVPLMRQKLKVRGFNQADEIARVLGSRLNCPVGAGALERIAAGEPQKALRRRDRVRQLRGAFRARRRFDGLQVGLVDDVVTTGSTAAELARVLLGAGALVVDVLALARTPHGADRGRANAAL